MKKTISTLLSIAMVLTALTGCAQPAPVSSGTTESTPSSPAPVAAPVSKTFVFGAVNEPPSIDPGKVSGSTSAPVINAMYEGLVTVDPSTGKAIPGAAESWEISADGLVYTFKLRADGKWSDGKPVTANDFVYSWRRVLNPETASVYSWFVQMFIKNGTEYNTGKVAVEEVGVKAVSDYVLEVTLARPTSYFIQALLNTIWVPVREDMVTQSPDKWIFDGATNIGNGAYRLVEYKIGESVLLEKNAHYWNKNEATAEQIKIVFLPDANTCYASFQTGEIQATMDVPTADVSQLMATDDRLHIQNGLNLNFLRLNTKVKGLDNMKVRQAINMAFDRQAYLEGLGSTLAQPALGAVPSNVILAGKDFRETAGSYNLANTAQVDKAKALLVEAGYPNGEGLPVYEIHCTDKQIKAAEIVQEQLRVNLGIETKIAPVDSKMFFPMMVEGKYQIGFGGWGGDYDHPMTFLDLFLSTASDNCTGWANAEFDKLIADARVQNDEAKQLEMLLKAEGLLINESPIVPVSFPVTLMLAADTVSGWYLTASQQLYLSNVVVK